jgi:hypothetical protein
LGLNFNYWNLIQKVARRDQKPYIKLPVNGFSNASIYLT